MLVKTGKVIAGKTPCTQTGQKSDKIIDGEALAKSETIKKSITKTATELKYE
jgi:hypothetical protein